jgi:hypothetical protein
MMPHEERVVSEEKELCEKLIKLTEFILKNEAFKVLPNVEKVLLKRQRTFMMQYRNILIERIHRFSV